MMGLISIKTHVADGGLNFVQLVASFSRFLKKKQNNILDYIALAPDFQ